MKPLTFYFHFSSVNIKSAKTSNYCVFTDYRYTIQIHKTSSVLLNCDRSTLTLAPCKLLRFFKTYSCPLALGHYFVVIGNFVALYRTVHPLSCYLANCFYSPFCIPSFCHSTTIFLNYRHKKIRV